MDPYSVRLSRHAGPTPVLTRYNATDQNPVDVPARSLKVATRVRIPLGLQSGLFPIGRASVVRVGSCTTRR
jgi:hypothetical protein